MGQTTIRQRILLAMVAATALAMAPRSARACGSGHSGYAAAYAMIMVLGAADLGLTIWDGGSALVSHRPSAAYGVFETLVAAPQAVLGLAALSSYGGRNGSGGLVLYTLWMGLLTTHGIWTIAHACQETSSTFEDPPGAPAKDEPLPRLQIGVGPTYVPVGQLAQPGIGLVGRF
jgi:hypothetical protein